MNPTPGMSWNWIRDELILAVDLYLRRDPLPSSAADEVVVALSETLRSLPLFPPEERKDNFRNPTGVYFKLLNIHYVATDGKAGYSNFAAADKRLGTSSLAIEADSAPQRARFVRPRASNR